MTPSYESRDRYTDIDSSGQVWHVFVFKYKWCVWKLYPWQLILTFSFFIRPMGDVHVNWTYEFFFFLHVEIFIPVNEYLDKFRNFNLCIKLKGDFPK